jgi:hypothetical protein
MSESILVPFSVSPKALGDGKSFELDAAHHRRLVETWRDTGVLVLPGDNLLTSELLIAVKRLSGDARKAWEIALRAVESRRLRLVYESELEPLAQQDEAALPAGCSHHAQVLALDPRTVKTLRARMAGRVEVASIDVVDQCDAFVQSRRLARESVKRYDPVRETWDARVAPLMRYARSRVALIDRYAVSSAWESRDKSGSYAKTGLARFLRDVGRLADRIDVQMFAADPDRDPGLVARELRACADEVLGPRRKRIRAYTVPARHFKAEVHYRCILVDATTCLCLDFGIQAFHGQTVGKKCDVKLSHPDSVVGGDIDNLRRVSDQELV